MKILLTGGTGFIGSHTAVELIQHGHEVEIVDDLSNSKITVLDSIAKITGTKPAFYEFSLLEKPKLNSLLKTQEYDAIIHLAGLKAVSESIEKPLKYYRNNLLSTLNLLEAMKASGTKKLVFSSSATVYGDQDGIKLTENHPTGIGITNPYGQSKHIIEQILKDASRADPSLEVTILRYFNPVGAHPSGLIGEDPNGIPNNLMPIIMKVASHEIKELSIYGDDYDTPDGTGMRDFIHVIDLADGHISALEHSQPGVNIYNLGTGEATSVMTVVKAFEKASGHPLPFRIAPRRPGDLAKIIADPTMAKTKLNWHATRTIDDIMRDTLKYLDYIKTIQ